MDLELIDANKGAADVLNPGDKIRTDGKDHLITEDHFESPDELALLLSRLSGAKVQLVSRKNSGSFYLLFSDVETLSLELAYIYSITDHTTPSDDELLLAGHETLSAADLTKLVLPLNPAENLCPAFNGHVQENCYAAHIDYMSSAFLFYKSVEESVVLGDSIKRKFKTDDTLDESTLTQFFEERHFALQTYRDAVLDSAMRLKGF
jgi:hypothetical protein